MNPPVSKKQVSNPIKAAQNKKRNKRKKIIFSLLTALTLLLSFYFMFEHYLESMEDFNYYKNLAFNCKHNQYPQCCLDSVDRLKSKNLKVKTEDCPRGSALTRLTCPSSYSWCE